MALANAIAEKAEAATHHPDLLVQWGRLTATLTTHDAGRTWKLTRFEV